MNNSRKFSFKKSVLIGLPVLLLVLVSVISLWIVASQSGASWLWQRLENAMAGSLQSSRVEGDLASGFVIHGLKYHSQGTEVAVARVDISARPGAWPISIQVQKLLLQDVTITNRTSVDPLGADDGQLDPASIIEAISLPLPLEIHHVELTNIALRQNDTEPAVLAESLKFKLKLDKQVNVTQLVFSSAVIDARGQGKLALESPYHLAVSLETQLDMKPELTHKLPLVFEASGSLHQLLFRLSSDHLGLDLEGELLDPLNEQQWDISGVLQQLPQTMGFSGQDIALSEVTLSSEGSIDNWSADLGSGLNIANQKAANLVVSATGSESGIQISHSSIKGPGVDLGATGELDWSSRLQGSLHTVIHALDVSPWLQDWPEAEYLAGELDMEWSGAGLEIPVGRLTVSGSEISVDIKADIDLEDNRVDAGLAWAELSWPLKSSTPVFNSPKGQLSFSGSIDQWTTGGQLDVQLGQYPQGQFQIRGGGDRGSAQIELLDGEILGGSLKGLADAKWQDGFGWGVDLLARAIDPEPLIPGWPGRLDADFKIRSDDQAEHLHVDIDAFEGMLRGVRISAQGGMEFVKQAIRFDQFEFRTDDAILQLDGYSIEPEGVAARFAGDLPSVFLQGASGHVEMEGRFSNRPGHHPVLEMQMQALDFAWAGLGIKTLTVATGKGHANSPVPTIDLGASELVWKNKPVDEIWLSLQPDGSQSRLEARLASKLLDLTASMDIAPEDPEDFLHGPWAGVLNDLHMVINEKYNFKLTEPSPFAWSADSLLLKSACLSESGDAGLCLGFEYQANSVFSVRADVAALPLDYLAGPLELDVRFEQVLEGHLEWHQPDGQAATGGAEFRVSGGRVMDMIDNESLINSNEGVFGFVLRDGNLETGVVDIEFPGVGFVDIDFDVLDIALNGRNNLKGRVVSELSDITQLAQLVLPGVDNVGGQFNSNISLGGTVVDPAFEGGFKLENGVFYYAPIGLKLEDISFAGQIDSRDQGSLTGQFKAGEGIGLIDGDFAFESVDHLMMKLALSGDQLLLVNTESLSMLTETELDIGLSPGRIDINGKIRVPSARLAPANLLLETVSDSEDLIIESRGQEETDTYANKPPANQVFGDLEVSFGENVEIKVPGVETSIGGSVTYHWSGNPVPIGEGSYVLNGNVDVYGPTLDIDNGSVSFPGVPANNPLLNIRAQRDIYGNTQIRSAGVQVIGTLKRPVLEAYTVPVTNEDRAWTLLVTGSDFDQGQGVGGFDVGTYIAPRLYVSYGISLFEDENVVSARYDLKKGFGIKVTSGQRETGLDVSYTIDR